MMRQWLVFWAAATCALYGTTARADARTFIVSSGRSGVSASADSAVISMPLPADDGYFPAGVGMTWTYGGSPMEVARIVRILEVEETENGPVYLWDGFQGKRAVRKAVRKIMERRGEAWGLLFDLGADVGASWKIEGTDDLLDGTTVTVVSRSAAVAVPYGKFEGCIQLGLRPSPALADAGVVGMWFAPGVGLVKWIEQSIAGPQTYELMNFAYRWEPPVDPRPGPLPVEPRLKAELKTDFIASGDSVRVSYRLINMADEAVKLIYRSGQQYDLVLEGIEGEVWRWSEGRGFHDALWEQTLGPRDTLAVQETLAVPDLSGVIGKTYVLSGFLTVTPDAPGAVAQQETKAMLKFTVQPEGNPKVEALGIALDSAGRESRTADFDGDGVVNFADFLLFARAFGKTSGMQGYDPVFDLDGDGAIEFADFLLFTLAFGK